MSSTVFIVFLAFTLLASCSAQVDTQCPVSFTSYNGKCFITTGSATDWNGAKALCAGYDRDPLSIRTENDRLYFVNYAYIRDAYSVWVGATDILNEGEFIWEDTRQPITVDFEQIFNRSTNTDDKDCLIANYGENKIVATECSKTPVYGICVEKIVHETTTAQETTVTTTPQETTESTTSTTKRPRHPCRKG